MSPTSEKVTVGVADLAVRKSRDCRLVTHALGSCIGITVYDPEHGVGGMLHFMLPKAATPKMDSDRPPAMFASKGIPLLFRKAYELGGEKNRLIVCAAGGAEFLEDCAGFQVGKRNKVMMKKLFFKNDIVLAAEDTGGSRARTMYLDLSDGKVTIGSGVNEETLWTP